MESTQHSAFKLPDRIRDLEQQLLLQPYQISQLVYDSGLYTLKARKLTLRQPVVRHIYLELGWSLFRIRLSDLKIEPVTLN